MQERLPGVLDVPKVCQRPELPIYLGALLCCFFFYVYFHDLSNVGCAATYRHYTAALEEMANSS